MTRTPFSERLSKFVRAVIRRTHGQDLIEYAMLAGIASAVVVMALNNISSRVANFYGATVTEIGARTAAAGTVPDGGGSGGRGNGGGNGNGKP
jgi:Flp pilus assembly pilin Flp